MIIGLLSKKRHGKDTFADHIVKNYNFQKYSLADPLKQACKSLFDFNDEQLFGDLKEEKDDFWKVSPRVIMQYLGTDIFRKDLRKILPDIGDNFWINKFKQKSLKNRNISYVVADVRFQNEVDIIHELDGIVIKIERPSLEADTDLHSSEKNIDSIKNYDFLVENNSTKEEYYQKIDKFMKNLI